MDPSDVDDVRIELARWVGSNLAVDQPEGVPPGRATVSAYLPDGPDCMRVRGQIEMALWHLGGTGASSLREPNVRWISPDEYLNEWRKFYRPLAIGDGFVVVPSWLELPETPRRVIRLDPGMAFGTGLHPTTQLAVEALERAVDENHFVLDVGSGSGILAIVAAFLGARCVLSIDTDPDAVRTALNNVAMNGCENRVAVSAGPMSKAGVENADILVANIVADVHLRNLGRYAMATRPGGIVILGGVMRARRKEVQSAAQLYSLEFESASEWDDWVCLTLRCRIPVMPPR